MLEWAAYYAACALLWIFMASGFDEDDVHVDYGDRSDPGWGRSELMSITPAELKEINKKLKNIDL